MCRNLSQVLWRLGNNVDPRRDVVFAGRAGGCPGSCLAPARYGSKMGIGRHPEVAEEGFTRPWPSDPHGPGNQTPGG